MFYTTMSSPLSKLDEFGLPDELPPELVSKGYRLCTAEEMTTLPKLFANLGIADENGNLLVSPDPDKGE